MLNALEQANVAAPQAGTALGEPATTSAERRARGDLRRQIARLERELGELFASAFPRPGFEWGIGAPGRPARAPDRGTRAGPRRARAPPPRRPGRARPPSRASRTANRALLESMIAAPEAIAGLVISQTRDRRAGLRQLAIAPATGDPRHPLRLVAGQALLGLSVSHGASAPGRRPYLMAKRRRKRRPRRAPQAPDQRPAARSAEVAAKPAPQPRRPIEEERPPAPWGSFPLVEIVVLVGLRCSIGWPRRPAASGARCCSPPGWRSARWRGSSSRSASISPAIARTP